MPNRRPATFNRAHSIHFVYFHDFLAVCSRLLRKYTLCELFPHFLFLFCLIEFLSSAAALNGMAEAWLHAVCSHRTKDYYVVYQICKQNSLRSIAERSAFRTSDVMKEKRNVHGKTIIIRMLQMQSVCVECGLSTASDVR